MPEAVEPINYALLRQENRRDAFPLCASHAADMDPATTTRCRRVMPCAIKGCENWAAHWVVDAA